MKRFFLLFVVLLSTFEILKKEKVERQFKDFTKRYLAECSGKNLRYTLFKPPNNF